MHHVTLTHESFEKLQAFIYQTSAINLSDKKFALVQSRLQKRVRTLGLGSFEDYYDYLHTHPDEITELIDAISTNVTHFFREERQWHFLEENIAYIRELLQKHGKLRIWSAACSSGQEPYSIAMFLWRNLPNAHLYDIKILATDISTDILKKATEGIYSEKDVIGMDPLYLKNFFERSKDFKGAMQYSIGDKARQWILFRQFNLTRGDYSMFSGKQFDIIFCRNVMIYFDNATRMALLEEFYHLLHKHGMLFLGHSETITAAMLKKFKLISPSMYRVIK